MAKNVFGVRNDADKIDGESFIIRTTPPEVKEKIASLGKDADAFAEEYRPSRRVALLRNLAMILGVVLLMVAYSNAASAEITTFGGMLRAYPVMFIASFALWAFAIGTIFYERARAKKAQAGETANDLQQRSDAIDGEAYAALNVPQDAISLDLLSSTYRVKNGEVKNTLHTAFAFRAFAENGCLCLADVENVVAIPIDDIAGFTRLDRNIAFYFWNKPESPRSETYRPYRIRTTYFGAFTVKGVVVMHIRSEFGEYEILIPPYEVEAVRQLTGKGPEPQAEN